MSELEPGDLLSRLWEEHRHAEFPACLRGRVIAGQDMVLLDSDTAGCVHSAVHGSLDERRHGILLACIASLEAVLSSIEDEYGSRYYERLHAAALLAADRGVD